jgi:hypothetical protein
VHKFRWLSYQPIALLHGCFGAKWSNQNLIHLLFCCTKQAAFVRFHLLLFFY